MKQTPWQRFSFWVHWWYPQEEAREILSDYEELPDPDLSHPLQIIQDLGVSRRIWRWLTVFGILTVFLLIPVLSIFGVDCYGYYNISLFIQFCPIFGFALSFVWFQPGKKGPLTKEFALFFFVEWLVFFLAVGLLALLVSSPQHIIEFLNKLKTIWIGLALIFDFDRIVILLGFAGAALGFLGLNRARTDHRRWRAAYVLGLTILCLCICILAVVWDMGIQGRAVLRAVRVMLMGLALTGVSLC